MAESMFGYCVKCRQSRPMKDPWTIVNKRGVPMRQATCGECGRLVNTFVKRSPDASKISAGGEDGPEEKGPSKSPQTPKDPKRPKPTPTPDPDRPAAVDEGAKKRKEAPLLSRKRDRGKREGKARRALQESVRELCKDEPVCDESEGE